MIAGAAFCPHPPALVPAVAAGAAGDLADVLAACDEALERLAADAPVVVVLGAGPTTGRLPPRARGALSGFGVGGVDGMDPADEATPRHDGSPLPLALMMGRWLVDRRPELVVKALVAVGPADIAVALDELGGVTTSERVGLLVMGDGSARHGAKAPGYHDARAAGYDQAVRAALATGDAAALTGLDADLAAALLSAGGPPWRAAGSALRKETGNAAWAGHLLYSAAPFGVGYHVAYWRRP
ncbi:MAG: hypothetical protein ABJA87_06035 [bacterium]